MRQIIRIRCFAVAILFVALSVTGLKADAFSNNFKANLNQASLDALAQDMGALVGGGSFHTAKGKGLLPVGGDIGLNVPVINVSNDDPILKDDGSTANAVIAQGDLLLPFNFGIILRGGNIDSANMIGGGLRYNILNMDAPLMPSLMVSALYGRTTQDYFDMDTYTGNIVVSMNVPIINPYLGFGYDSSTLSPTAAGLAGTSASSSLEGKADSARFEAGVNLTFFPFTYITLGAGVDNGEAMYHGAVGAHF